MPARVGGAAPRRPAAVDVHGRRHRHRQPAGRRHPVPDRLGHQDLHRGAGACSAATTGCSTSTTRSAGTCRAGARRADRPPAAVAHRRACSASRTATSGTPCARRTSTSCSAELDRAERVLPPARRFHYSNLGMALLGHLVGRLRGGTWAEVLAERILDPLGLTDTAVDAGPTAAAGLPGRRVLRPRAAGAADRLRRGRPGRPAVEHRGRPGPLGGVPGRPGGAWTRPARCSPRPLWRRCAGR